MGPGSLTVYCTCQTKAAGHRSQRPPPPRIWASVPRHSGLRRFPLWSDAGHAPKRRFWRPCGAARRFLYRAVTVTTGRAAFWAAPLRVRAVTPKTPRRIGLECTVVVVLMYVVLPGETLHVRVAGRQVSIALPTSGFQHSPESVRCRARRSRCELKSDVEADGRGGCEACVRPRSF